MNLRRRTVLIAASVFTGLTATGCYYSTGSTSWKSYEDHNSKSTTSSTFAQQLAMGDSLGGSVWSPVINEHVALARADFYRRSATASAPTD